MVCFENSFIICTLFNLGPIHIMAFSFGQVLVNLPKSQPISPIITPERIFNVLAF